MSSIRTVKAPPGATRLIESLRGLGYEFITAVADIVDNSVSAGATEVFVELLQDTNDGGPLVFIADNGEGMDRDGLINAMRFGADQKYSAEDLGKFGLGLKTASLSQCRNLTVASKPAVKRGAKSRRNVMRWDLDHVYKKDEWELQILEDKDLSKTELEKIEEYLGDQGTIVLWSDLRESLPILYSKDEKKKSRFLATLLSDLSEHLSMVFHRFMLGQVSGSSKLKLHLCGSLLEPWDPFCVTEKHTESLKPVPIKIDGENGSGKITITPYILPKESKFSSSENWKKASGPRGWNLQQGFYFYRNGRMLQSGGWSYLRTPDEHTKLLRIAIDFPGSLDTTFQINVTKMKAKIPDEIWTELKEKVSEWAQRARRAYDKKDATSRSGSSRTSPSSTVQRATPGETSGQRADFKFGPVQMVVSNAPTTAVTATSGAQGLKIIVPYKHLSATVFHAKKGRPFEQRDALLMLLALLEAVVDGKISISKVPIESIKKQIQKLV